MSDRLVQTVAALLAAAAFAGAAALSPGIDRQRRECKMAYEPSGGGDDKDVVYRLVENLGALRGVAINVLWNRLENQKQAKRYHDADAIARCITRLQPRMPEVWRYMAFNLAYNVSVKCQTQEERFAWVNRGLRILKDEGIPNNPSAEPLYRELAWIYQHKIGGETDDMNRYFKKRLAEAWQIILGAPPLGRQPKAGGVLGQTEEIATGQMRLVARAADEAYAKLADGGRAGSVAPARKEAFLAAHPDAAYAVAQVDAACRAIGEPEPGLSADLGLAVGRLLAFGDYVRMAEDAGFSGLSKSLEARLGGQGRAVLSVLRKDERARAGIDQLLPWLRAMVIVERERMDPAAMLAMMEEYGPLDWRHPQAHAMYWALQGAKKADHPDHLTVVNTDRSVVAGTQGMMHSGRLFYDPVEDFLSDQPDPRFIDAYDRAQQMMRDKAAKGVYATEQGVLRSVDRGEENFLHAAIQVSYLFGEEAAAQKYFRRVKEKFPDSPVYAQYYHLTLPDFVVVTIREDHIRVVQEAALAGLLSRGLEAAFLQHDGARAQRLFKMAEATRAGIEKDRAEAAQAAIGGEDARQPVPPLEQMHEQALRRFLTEPGHTLRDRAAMWAQLPTPAKLVLFDDIERTVYPQVKASGVPVPPQAYFPPPQGLEEFRKQRGSKGGSGVVAPDRR